MIVIRGKGRWGQNEKCKGDQIYGDIGDQTSGGEHAMPYTDVL